MMVVYNKGWNVRPIINFDLLQKTAEWQSGIMLFDMKVSKKQGRAIEFLYVETFVETKQ